MKYTYGKVFLTTEMSETKNQLNNTTQGKHHNPAVFCFYDVVFFSFSDFSFFFLRAVGMR